MSEITTIGTMLINDALPEDLRRGEHALDKKGVHRLFMQLAEKYPDEYKDVLKKLSNVGRTAAWTEGMSVSLAALRRSQAKDRVLGPVRHQINRILEDDSLTDEQRKEQMIDTLIKVSPKLQKEVFEESKRERSPFALQIQSGARGNPGSLASLRGADLLATDQEDRFIPVPLMHSYAEGFTPAEYFAASYGQRKGQLDVKMATADAGFLNKQLVNAAHRQVITREQPNQTRLPTGLPVKTDDRHNVGAVLAIDTGPIKAGTVLTSDMLSRLSDEGHDELLIYSPMTEMSEDGGISALAAGRRTRQGLHLIGDNIGIPAAQAIGERLGQGALSSKHTAGVQTRIPKAGFEYINRLIQAPETFPEAGPLSEQEGTVNDVKKASQGGHYIVVGDKSYYAGPDLEVKVRVGDQVERGDDLTDGTPHPRDLVRLRGVGEARRVYLGHLRDALENSGIKVHRRNLESVVTGLLNWARVTAPDGIGDNIYDDVVPYNRLTYNYTPRPGAAALSPKKAVGRYLEEPVLHYTPGTQVTRRVAEQLEKWKVGDVYSHEDEPDFEPHMVRGMLSVYHDPDWKTQLAGFYTSRAFQRSLHRGGESDAQSTSFVPGITQPTRFARNLRTLGKYGETR